MIIKVKNTLPLQAEKTYLSNAISAAATVLPWRNPNAFAASWAVQIGETGQEQTEIKLLGTATPAGTAGTTTAGVSFDHPSDTPLYAIKYDQVVFERSTAGTAGTATPLTGGTVTIQADSDYTQFDDTSGSTSYAYRSYFKNSVLNVTTTESDWITPSGPSFYSLQKMRERVKDKLFSAGYIKDDSIINDWVNEWLETVTNAVVDTNQAFSVGTTSVTFSGTAELGTISATDFKYIHRVWFTGEGTTSYKATPMDVNDFEPYQTFGATTPRYYMQGDNIIGRKPADSSGTASIIYYKLPTVLVNDTDELPVYARAYTKSCVDYCLAQAKGKDNKATEQQTLEGKSDSGVDMLKRQVSPRDKSGQTFIDIVDPISGGG